MDLYRKKKDGWSPYLAGALVGLLAIASAWLTTVYMGKTNYLGASTTFVRAAGLVEEGVAPEHAANNAYFTKTKIKVDWQFMLVLGTFGPAFVLWFASQYLARIKRGRPDGYYTQAIHLWLAHRGLATPKFLIYHGWWGLGRSLDLSLASAFEPPPEKFSPPPHSDRVSDVQP